MKTKNNIKNIILGNSKKKIIITGPCSIHSYRSYLKYSKKILKIKKKLINLKLLMRIYLEKPRTINGWKGIIYDPEINNTFKIKKGLKKSLKILRNAKKNKIRVACEIINTNLFGYTKKYIDIVTIGARNNECQIYREISSSLNKPVGFKNNLNGEVEGSINSIISAKSPSIYSINKKKKINWKISKGNKNCFLIIRGGKKPNYFSNNLKKFIKILLKNKINTGIIIDINHGNSNKVFKKQINISNYIIKKILPYFNRFIGIMIESHLKSGSQIINKKIKYNISITDPCLSWKDTKKIIFKYNKKLYKLFI
ncbi:3-deoxy-7-phosphoheptulonate synthase [Candidatus Vidania fulgoroideorum]